MVTLAKGHSNDGPLPPFDISPCEAEIAGGESLSLKVRFNPDHASDAYWHLYEVSVPNQEAEPHLLLLRGRSFATAGYLLAPDQQPIDGPALMNLENKEVLVTFALKAEAIKSSELGLIASFGVSQWAEASLKCVLKGGSPPPVMPETEILLKGYIAGRSAGE